MKPTIKNLKTKFLYIILPTILVLTLVLLLFQTYQKTQILITGIRPFSELLATDFADVKDEVADPSKCDGSKVIEQIKKSSTNPNLADKWKDYDPNIHKLTILDDCWRQYENEYVRFKFRDLDGSLRMFGPNNFDLFDKYWAAFGVSIRDYYGPSYFSSMDRLKESYNFIDMNVFTNSNGLSIYRLREWKNSVTGVERFSLYTIDLPGKNKFIHVWGFSDRITKEILSTIEIKK